ncbi:hypothetical protein [Shewanella sp. VB17]|nr:hypothetical protein [Shewanella sp. VB17]
MAKQSKVIERVQALARVNDDIAAIWLYVREEKRREYTASLNTK